MRAESPWAAGNNKSGFSLALQQELVRFYPQLADELIAAATNDADLPLLIVGERAELLAAGKEDRIENYSPAAAALLAELRPGEAALAKQAQVAAEIADLEERSTAMVAARAEKQAARREAELAGRNSSQRALETTLQAGRLGG